MGKSEGMDAGLIQMESARGLCAIWTQRFLTSHLRESNTETQFLNVSQIIWNGCPSRKISALE